MPTPPLNPSSSYYSKLLSIWGFKEGSGFPQELLSNTPTTFSGSPQWVQELGAYGIQVGSSDSVILGTDSLLSTTPNQTFLIRARLRSGDGSQRFGTDSPTAAKLFGGHFPYSDTNIYFTWGGVTANVSMLVIGGQSFSADPNPATAPLDTFVVRVNGSEIRMWRNGTDIGHTTGGAPPTRTNDGSNLRINGWQGLTGDDQFIDLCAIFDGTLSDGQCAALSLDPWAELFSMSGSGSIDLSATGHLSFPPINLSGAGSIDVGASADLSLAPNPLHVLFDVAEPVRGPLVVQFDVVGVTTALDALKVKFDVVEGLGAPLLVTFDVLDEIVSLRLNDDIQAPVARVTLT